MSLRPGVCAPASHTCPCRHAFAADSLLSLVYQIVRGNFPPIPANQFSPGLSNLVNSLLVRDAAQRPSLTQVRDGSSSVTVEPRAEPGHNSFR